MTAFDVYYANFTEAYIAKLTQAKLKNLWSYHRIATYFPREPVWCVNTVREAYQTLIRQSRNRSATPTLMPPFHGPLLEPDLHHDDPA